jgi:hypothetical protein
MNLLGASVDHGHAPANVGKARFNPEQNEESEEPKPDVSWPRDNPLEQQIRSPSAIPNSVLPVRPCLTVHSMTPPITMKARPTAVMTTRIRKSVRMDRPTAIATWVVRGNRAPAQPTETVTGTTKVVGGLIQANHLLAGEESTSVGGCPGGLA